MKILFEDLIVKQIDPNIIYKLEIEAIDSENGLEDCSICLEEMRVDELPNDNSQYLIWVELTNHKGQYKFVLANYYPWVQVTMTPFYVPDSVGRLIDIAEIGFDDFEKCAPVPLLLQKYYDKGAGNATSDMPDIFN